MQLLILIRNNYNIVVNFEHCLLLDTIPAENINAVNETEFAELFKNGIETRIIKKHLKKMKGYVGI